jgi:hypothetical protein
MDYYKNLDLTDIVYFCEIDKIYKTEQWKDVPDYEGIYQVSDLGRVKSLSRAFTRKGAISHYLKTKILKQNINSTTYLAVSLHKNSNVKSFQSHQVVAMAFLGHKPDKMNLVINHKDFNKLNNRISNLEIVTMRVNGNQKHLKSTSIYTGVFWNKSKNKWTSKIRINKKICHLGHFTNEIDAHNAYEKKLASLSNS